MIVALSSNCVEARQLAASTLGDIGDKKAAGALIAILEGKQAGEELRKSVAEALGKIGDTGAVEPLLNVACGDDDYAVRCLSVIALGELGDRRAVDGLLALLSDRGSPLVRTRGLAAQALGKMGDQRAVEALIAAVLDPRESEWVKDNVVWALGQIGDVVAAGPLLGYLKSLQSCWAGDGEDSVKAVIQALDKIGLLSIHVNPT